MRGGILKVLCSILRGLSVISSLDMGVCGEMRGFVIFDDHDFYDHGHTF